MDGANKVGVVSHYFGKIGVVAVKLSDVLKVGDKIKIVGTTTDLEDVVKTIQIEHESVSEAGAGEEVGLKINGRAREGDRVYIV